MMIIITIDDDDELLFLHLWESGWWEGGSEWVEWPVARRCNIIDVVQTGSNKQHPVTQ